MKLSSRNPKDTPLEKRCNELSQKRGQKDYTTLQGSYYLPSNFLSCLQQTEEIIIPGQPMEPVPPRAWIPNQQIENPGKMVE